jgi:signal transduction histidine kinase/DNA-binding response OmpR family regulator
MSFELSRRRNLTDLFGLLAAITSFPYIFIFSGNEAFLRYLTLVFFTICLICVFLNRKGFHFLAKHGLFLSSNLYLFATASAFGRATGEQLVYLPVIFGAVLIYDFTELKSLVFSVAVTIVCIVSLEFTDYSLFTVGLTPSEQLDYYHGNIFITFALSIIIALFYFRLYARQNIRNEQIIQSSQEVETIISYFATSLYGKNTIDEILWDIAKNCISQLGFQDCVIYLLDEKNKQLEQKAAFGPKNPKAFEISHLITIPVGNGIVGAVAQTGIAEVITDTSKDPRYIVDDQIRLSEITVPILYQDRVIGVIDSEHPDKNFFTETHLRILQTIAALCSNKMIKAIAEEEKVKATMERLEADKIKEVDRLKSQFFSHISHEFRTPLTLILGPLDEMIRRGARPEDQDQLKLMQANGKRLLQLINDLLELSRLNEGILNLELRKGDIADLLRITVTSFHSLAAQKSIEIGLNLPPEPLILSYDSSKIETILINLLSNAIKFAPVRGQVEVWVDLVSGNLEITVFNNGLHISPARLETIFERTGERDHSTDKERHGIGLALSKELAVMHGGTIHVASDQTGSRFTLSIPATSLRSSRASHAPASPDMPETPPATIDIDQEFQNKLPVVLIVEDSEQLRLFLRKILMDDFQLVEAGNGKEGLRTCLESIPDLVISDIMMPEMDGMELCRKIKASEMTSHIPVLLLTALADLESKLEGLETGADYYLAKPFEPRELLTVSSNLIAQRKKLRDYFSRKILLKTQEWDGMNADEIFLQKLLSLVESHLSDPDFTIESIQKELGISRMQLHRKLKALTDKSATEFIRTIRLKIAAEKLQKGQENVSQIAYQVGFNSLSYFTKCFKEQFGVIPSAYGVRKSP